MSVLSTNICLPHMDTMLFGIDYSHSGPYPACLTQVPSSSSSGNLYLSNDQSKRKKGGMGGRRFFLLLCSPGTLILFFFFFAEKHKTFEVEIISLEKERENYVLQ